MKREADKNRVRRAIEHLNAAKTNLESIKSTNIETEEHIIILKALADIKGCVIWRLANLIKEEENK